MILWVGVLVPESSVAARCSRGDAVVVPIPQGVYVIDNPCARAGAGESIALTSGSSVLTYDRKGRLSEVTYHDVTGVGEVSGAPYTAAYEESHRYNGNRERFSSELIVSVVDRS